MNEWMMRSKKGEIQLSPPLDNEKKCCFFCQSCSWLVGWWWISSIWWSLCDNHIIIWQCEKNWQTPHTHLQYRNDNFVVSFFTFFSSKMFVLLWNDSKTQMIKIFEETSIVVKKYESFFDSITNQSCAVVINVVTHHYSNQESRFFFCQKVIIINYFTTMKFLKNSLIAHLQIMITHTLPHLTYIIIIWICRDKSKKAKKKTTKNENSLFDRWTCCCCYCLDWWWWWTSKVY